MHKLTNIFLFTVLLSLFVSGSEKAAIYRILSTEKGVSIHVSEGFVYLTYLFEEKNNYWKPKYTQKVENKVFPKTAKDFQPFITRESEHRTWLFSKIGRIEESGYLNDKGIDYLFDLLARNNLALLK